MAHFIGKSPVKVHLPDDEEEYILIKPRLSHGDRAYVQDQIYEVGVEVSEEQTPGQETPDNPATVKVHMAAATAALLERGVIGWQLWEEGAERTEENKIAFSKALVAQADPEDPLWDLVIQELLDRNPTLLEVRANKATKAGS